MWWKNHGAPNQKWWKHGGKHVVEVEKKKFLKKKILGEKFAYRLHFSFHPVFSTTIFHHDFPPRKNRRSRPITTIIFFLFFFRKKRRKNFCKGAAAEGVYGGNKWWKPLHLSRFTNIRMPWRFVNYI